MIPAQKTNSFRRAVPIAVFCIFGAACRTRTIIDSSPRGAHVTIAGRTGITPFTIDLPRTTFTPYQYSISMSGFEAGTGTIERETDIGAILLSLPFPPALLTTVYRAKSYVCIEMKPVQEFPDAFAHTEPWTPDLPPLPPGMVGAVRNRERAVDESPASMPAPENR